MGEKVARITFFAATEGQIVLLQTHPINCVNNFSCGYCGYYYYYWLIKVFISGFLYYISSYRFFCVSLTWVRFLCSPIFFFIFKRYIKETQFLIVFNIRYQLAMLLIALFTSVQCLSNDFVLEQNVSNCCVVETQEKKKKGNDGEN